MLALNEFLHAAGIDNINLFKLERYLRRSRLPQKLRGFAAKRRAAEEAAARERRQRVPGDRA